jgi:hypothetical protein
MDSRHATEGQRGATPRFRGTQPIALQVSGAALEVIADFVR